MPFRTFFKAIAQRRKGVFSGDAAKVDQINKLIEGFEFKFEVLTIDPTDAIEKIGAEDTVFVDVRDADEMATSIIPGAISKKELEDSLDLYRDKEIIAYCTIGFRSSKYCLKLHQLGILAKNLRGSVLLWAHAGGLFVDAKGAETNIVHVYGKHWDLLPEGYAGVMKKPDTREVAAEVHPNKKVS